MICRTPNAATPYAITVLKTRRRCNSASTDGTTAALSRMTRVASSSMPRGAVGFGPSREPRCALAGRAVRRSRFSRVDHRADDCSCAVESPHRCGAQPDEQPEHQELGRDERRLLLRRSHGDQCGEPEEQLREQHEDVQVQRQDGTGHVDAAPRSHQMLQVTRDDDAGEDGKRKDRDDVRRQHLLEREAEPGQVRRNRRGEEYPGPAVEPLPGDEPSGYHRSGHDTRQAQDDVEERVEAECRAHEWVLSDADRSAMPTTRSGFSIAFGRGRYPPPGFQIVSGTKTRGPPMSREHGNIEGLAIQCTGRLTHYSSMREILFMIEAIAVPPARKIA